MGKIFGYELVLDVGNCNEAIKSELSLKEYLKDLCLKIKMKAYGDPIIKYFGLASDKTQGYTAIQLIETSSISGHFSESWKTAHLNVFSCMDFDPDLVEEYTLKFFDAKLIKKEYLVRLGE